MTMDLKEEKVTDLSNWTFNEISIFDWSLVAKLEAGKKEEDVRHLWTGK